MKDPWVEYDHDSLEVTWTFGPQGHPASMRVIITLFEDNSMQPRLLVMGLGIGLDSILYCLAQLSLWLDYGELIETEFGRDCSWWHCKKCEKRFNCSECKEIRQIEANRTEEWIIRHPIPEVII